MSTRLALTVVGTLVGAYFGYPQLGAMAGAMIGSAVDPTTIQGPRINESGTQTVAEGIPRTIVYGTWKCTGNIIQRGPLVKVETSTSQGKGSTKIKGEKGLRTYAIGICEGPIAVGGLLRVWRNKKLVYDVTTGSAMLAESQKWADGKRFYTGDETQLPDPDLELLDPDATAHRGSCYMVFPQDDVTDMNGAIPQYEFEVARYVTANTVALPRVVVGSRQLSGVTGGGNVTTQTNNADAMAAPGSVWLAFFQLSPWTTSCTVRMWIKIGGVPFWEHTETVLIGQTTNVRIQLNIAAGAQTVQTGFNCSAGSISTMNIAVVAPNAGGDTYTAYAPNGEMPPAYYTSASPYFGIVKDSGGTLKSMSYFRDLPGPTEMWGPATFQDGYSGAGQSLSSIVSDICLRCGVTSIDTSELTDTVRGYGLSSAGYTGADSIDALRMAHFFDKSARDKIIYYPKRGKAVVKTITINDLTQIPDSTRREQTSEIPYKLNVRYPNQDSGWAVLKETTGSWTPDRRTTGEVTLDIPISLTSDQAAQIADKQYKTMLAEVNGTVELSVMLDAGTDLAEADCIAFEGERLRIEESEFADWSMKFKLKADRQSAYTSNVTGIPAPPPTLPPSTIVGETEFVVIDGPARTDSEDDISYLAAATGAMPAWYGAELQRSLDSGASYQAVYEFESAAIMGVLLEDISAASEHFTDTTNTAKIQLYRSTASIDSLTMGQFLSRQGVFALEKADGSFEYMQAKDVDPQLDGTYHLTSLHRGIANSGGAAHLVGARFVWLSDAVYIPASSAWLNAALTHRAVSFDEAEDDATNEITHTYVGRSQREWAPAYLRLLRDGANNITATWVGRGRFGNAFHPVQSKNSQGYRVTVTDGVTTTTVDTTGTTYSGTWAAPVTVSVVALNRITGASSATSGTV